MNIIDELIMESEYNVLMKLAEYYDKQYQMDFYAEAYFMEANGDNSSMSTKIKNGINTGIAAGKNAANNAVTAGKNAINEINNTNKMVWDISQYYANKGVNAAVKGVNTGINATKNFIGKVISWCKKAVTVVSSNANKIPPNKPVKVPQGVTKLKENITNLSQNIMPHVKKVNEQAASGQQVDPNVVQQLIARIDELEKQVKALKIKVAVQNITSQPQQQAPAPQPIQQPQTQQPQQQAPQPAPQPAPTPNPTPQQQPTASDNQTTYHFSDGTVTVQGNEVREMVKQSAGTLSNLEQFMNGFFNAHQNANAAIEELDKKAAQATATILNEVVATSKAAAAQCMPYDSDTSMTGAQLFQLVQQLRQRIGRDRQYRVFNVGTKRAEFVMNVAPNAGGSYITNINGNGPTAVGLLYPNQDNIFKSMAVNPGMVYDVKVNRCDDNTPIKLAKIDASGNIIEKGVIG